jgi:hypothetical protein
MRRTLVAALGGLVLGDLLLAAPASSGNGIKMRAVRGSLDAVRADPHDRIARDCELVERE